MYNIQEKNTEFFIQTLLPFSLRISLELVNFLDRVKLFEVQDITGSLKGISLVLM